MITNSSPRIGSEREYRITLESIRELEDDLAKAETYRAKRDPQVHQLVVAGIEGFLEDLREQAAEYEARFGMRKEDDHAR
jgi:hypothetical protein